VTRAPAQPPTRYTSPRVVRASTRLHQVWSPGQSLPRRAALALRALPAVVKCIVRLPVTPASVSSSPAGVTIQRRLRQRRCGLPVNRLAQGVLVLPEEFESYIGARRVRGLRKHMKRAKETMECHELRHGEHLGVIKPVLRDHDDARRPYSVRVRWWDEQLGLPGNRGWYVRTKAGQPVALALVTVDAQTAYLHALVSVESRARWLLHGTLVEDLHAAGVRLVLTYSTNALLLEPNLQQFQHQLGYTVANVKEVRGLEEPAAQRNARRALDADPEMTVSGYAA
jgi:hypothetical protein